MLAQQLSALNVGFNIHVSHGWIYSNREHDVSTRAKWSIVWGSWVVAFAIAETIAVRSDEYDAPLSAHLRYVLGARHPHPVRRASGAVIYAAGAVWLIDHLYRGVTE